MSDALLAFLAALAGAAGALWTSERNHRLENVTAERAAWRARIRLLAVDLLAGPDKAGDADAPQARKRAAAAIRLSTNPFDPLDREIVEIADRISAATSPDSSDLGLLALRLQLLLKHDWERAKTEASWTRTVLSAVRRLLRLPDRPKRPGYAAFVDWRERHPIASDVRLPPT